MLEELKASGFVGFFKDRPEMEDSPAFARHLRERVRQSLDSLPPDESED
jgi:hypothetical protein